MKAVQDGSDRSACTASSFDYEDFFSVLMYYYHMTTEEILNHSRRFLIAIYQKYAKRACENAGIPYDDTDGTNKDLREKQLSASDYPSEFISYTQLQREKEIEKSGISDKEFLSKFKQYNPHNNQGVKKYG